MAAHRLCFLISGHRESRQRQQLRFWNAIQWDLPGASYGDDAQSATNYPLVRITNNATGDLAYARTHNHSTMAVATGSALVSTLFDVPTNIETGPSTLQVVANGIPSAEVPINVSFGASANCPEATCTQVMNAYISHFTGIDCTGGEHYYTQYLVATAFAAAGMDKAFSELP